LFRLIRHSVISVFVTESTAIYLKQYENIYDHSYKLTCQRQTVYFFLLCLQDCLYRHIGVVIVTYVTQVPAVMLLYVQPY
jgi:hypothetical protein